MTSPPVLPGIERRIFVVGVPRSGTTLVQSLLAAHSRLTSFTESHFFDRHFTHLPGLSRPILTRNPLSRLREFLAENEEEPPPAARWFEDGGRWLQRPRPLLPFQTASVARQLLQVFDELALRRGASGWIEKTPRHLRYLPFLEKMLDSRALSAGKPRIDFVHMIRDGLEVVASLHKASQRWERPYDLKACIRRWNEDMSFSLSRLAAPNDHFVVYEELAAKPEATLRRLLTELGLSWEPDLLERYFRDSRSLVTPEETWKKGIGSSIRPSATSGRSLTAEQREKAMRSLDQDLYDELLGKIPRT